MFPHENPRNLLDRLVRAAFPLVATFRVDVVGILLFVGIKGLVEI